jgi:hypothetical protein
MTRTIRSAVCAVLFATSAATSFATPAVAAEPAPTAIGAASEACARRYLKALDMEKMMVAMMDAMIPAMLQGMPNADRLDANQRQQILEAANEGLREVLPSMITDMVPPMTATFTEGELCAAADFYESAAGRSLLAKMPAYMQASQQQMARYIPIIQQAMTRRMCAKVGCGPESDPKKSRNDS